MNRGRGFRVRALALVMLFALVLTIAMPRALAQNAPPQINAASYVLLEGDTRAILCASQAHKKLPMASTTKIMTALLALEHCALDDTVTVPAQAYGVEGSSMYLEKGEKLSVRDLLYGLMLVSGNDAAITLAIHIGGSVEGFAQLMNARARAIGALNTNFVTPNGLPDDSHYTTAYDLALIAAEAMEREEFRTLVSTTYHRTQSGNVTRTMKSKNRILWQYEGGCGIKTGFTKTAGKCLVFSAERDGIRLIGVLLNCPDMFEDAMDILDWGYDNYELVTAVREGSVVAIVRVENGLDNTLAALAKQDIIIPVRKGEGVSLITSVDCPKYVRAPVEAGDKLGTLKVYWDGTDSHAIACELIAGASVAPRGYVDWLRRIAKRWPS